MKTKVMEFTEEDLKIFAEELYISIDDIMLILKRQMVNEDLQRSIESASTTFEIEAIYNKIKKPSIEKFLAIKKWEEIAMLLIISAKTEKDSMYAYTQTRDGSKEEALAMEKWESWYPANN